MTTQRFIASWSGGKDSCYALHHACVGGAEPAALLTMLEVSGGYSRSHRLPVDLLRVQAESLRLPLYFGCADWADYEAEFIRQLIRARDEHDATAVVFGDIDIQGHRDWGERICSLPDVRMTPLFPLWGCDRRKIVNRMIASGQKSMIVSCNAQLGKTFLGRILDAQTLADLESAGVDICGENGEYHTVVLDCPRFSQPVLVSLGECRQQPAAPEDLPAEGYWFIDVGVRRK